MQIFQYFDVSLLTPGLQTVHMMQNDDVRRIQLRLYAGTISWMVPDGVTAGISYELPDRSGGYFEKLSDGSAACSIEGNEVTAVLAPILTSQAGTVKAAIVLTKDGGQLSTFPLQIRVTARPGLAPVPEAQPDAVSAYVGKFYFGGPQGAPVPLSVGDGLDVCDGALVVRGGGTADWNAAEGEPGHIANRTHWVDDPVTKVLLEATFSGEYDHAGLIGLAEGVVYDVTYNGQLYKCKCEKVTTIHPTIGSTLHGYAIGNIAAFTGTGNTGEPFVIGDILTLIYQGTLYAYNTVVAMQLGGDGSASIRVTVTTQETHKIDPVYLPESTHGPVAVQVPLDITTVDPSFATVVSAAPDEPMSPVFFVKVSDFVPALEEIKQCVLVHNFNGNEFSVSLDDSDPDDDGCRLNYGSFFTVVYDAAKSQEFAAGGNGIYFLYSDQIKTLRLYSDTVTMPGVEYRKIPAQYLPGLTAVAVTQAEYDALAAAGQADENTLYVITG